MLNSVFLYHAVQAGLDVAIVNPAHITPYAEIPDDQRQICDDLLFNRSEDALPRFIAYFEEHGGVQRQEEVADPTAGMTVDERIHYQILHRRKEGIEALIDTAVNGSRARRARVHRRDDAQLSNAAVTVLNGVLLPAMKDVGDRFGAGELILPFVLQSAEVMKTRGRAPGALSGARRRLHQGQGGAGDGLRRRA